MICYKNKHFTNKLHKAKHQFLQLKSFQHVTVYFPPSLTWVPQCLLYLCDHHQWRKKKKRIKKEKKGIQACRPGPVAAAVGWYRSQVHSDPSPGTGATRGAAPLPTLCSDETTGKASRLPRFQVLLSPMVRSETHLSLACLASSCWSNKVKQILSSMKFQLKGRVWTGRALWPVKGSTAGV